MTRKENLLGMGMVVINAVFVLQLSWIPVIFFLEGADWVTGGAAVGIHRFALVYVVAAPLAYGARRWFEGDRGEVLTSWLSPCGAKASWPTDPKGWPGRCPVPVRVASTTP